MPAAPATSYTFPEARLRCSKLMPYMTTHVMSLVPVESPGIGTMAIDKHCRVYFDPKVLKEWDIDMAAGVILHEDLHALLRHHERADNYLGKERTETQNQVWNYAADAVINQTLRKAGVKLPDGVVYPEKYGFPEGLSTEEYYDLFDQLPKVPVCVLLGGGSAADGQQKPWDQGPPSKGSGKGEGKDKGDGEGEGDGKETAPGLSDYEQKMLERQVAKAIDEQQKKGRGTVPGYLERFAAEVLRPRVDPVKELLACVKYALSATNGHGDYTWRKMPRRSPPGSIRLPAHIQPVPKVTIIADTSGSMGQRDLGLAMGVIALAVKALPSEGVKVIAGDAAVQAVTKVFRTEQVQLAGGGGTDMSLLIEEAAKMRPVPDVIVVCTDGETPWPDAPVGPRVVACLSRESSHYRVPEWIQKVLLEPQAA